VAPEEEEEEEEEKGGGKSAAPPSHDLFCYRRCYVHTTALHFIRFVKYRMFGLSAICASQSPLSSRIAMEPTPRVVDVRLSEKKKTADPV